jgi:8-oxo-dGTP diphosphatase
MERIVRCQTVVYQNGCILLLRHFNFIRGNSYWWLPGGGQEEGESYEQAAIRETREETNLIVRVERLLFELEDPERKYQYQKYLSFLAVPIRGELSVGFEGDAQNANRLKETRWVPLWDESTWESGFYEPHIHEMLVRAQREIKSG